MGSLSRSLYRSKLHEIESVAASLNQSSYTLNCLVSALSTLVISWEEYFIRAHNSEQHPYQKAEQLFGDVLSYLRILLVQDKYISNASFPLANECVQKRMEEGHQELFQELWTRYTEEDYNQRISDYVFRIKSNHLEHDIQEAKCIDFGCGHGNFAQALIQCGAKSVLGIDYGEKSISFAKQAAAKLGTRDLRFKQASVYDSGECSDEFDFAVQNGVFHHLEDEDLAYREVNRVLKSGGCFWVYTDGIDNIQGELQDSCSRIMRNWNQDAVHASLDNLALSTGKRYHMGDTFNAVYRHTDYGSMVRRLEAYGFKVERRLAGGFQYDSDGAALTKKWAAELYGSGDIRILARKVKSLF